MSRTFKVSHCTSFDQGQRAYIRSQMKSFQSIEELAKHCERHFRMDVAGVEISRKKLRELVQKETRRKALV